MAAPNRRWTEIAGLVLVCQRPGSAKDPMFITLGDETGIAHLVVCPEIFEAYRSIILSAGMIAAAGRIQQHSVVHLVVYRLVDLSTELASIGRRGEIFPLPHGRGDEVHRGAPVSDPRGQVANSPQAAPAQTPRPRDIYIPDLRIDAVKVKTRELR